MLDISFKGRISELCKMQNIAEKIGESDLKTIGLHCKGEFDSDKQSRAEWESWYGDAMKLALQVMEEKSFPWPGCSNVKFPLITIAALNFHAKAYPTLINGKDVVTYRVIGDDEDGKKLASAKRVTDHQNFTLLEQTSWEEQTDRALINLPIMGCVFKKTFYDPEKRMIVSDLRLAQDIVVPYYTKTLQTTARVSETFSLLPNQFKTRLRRGMYLDYKDKGYDDYAPTYGLVTADALTEARNTAQKTETRPYDAGAPAEFVEQHRWLDLDGDDYEEPYVVTFVRETGQVCRIVARYTTSSIEYGTKEVNGQKQIAYINPRHYYTKYSFIPSPDGGFYDLGFGMLLGPLNYAADSLINQLIDAGTMHNLGGGFLGRGVKIRRGESTFEPMEWKTVDSTGASLKDNIVPLPVRTPSQVLLDLLTFLVQYAERISSANEIQMGEIPGQNAKAGAMEIANQNGLRVFGSIYKRLWRCFKEEFALIYSATAVLSQSMELGGREADTGKWFKIQPDDYLLPPDGIWPCANPDIASQDQEVKQATLVLNNSLNIPGHDVYAATMRYYRALRVPNPEEVFPDPKGKNAIPAQPNVKLIDSQAKTMMAQARMMEVQYQKTVAFADIMRQVEETQAKIMELQAKAQKHQAEAQGVQQGHAIALIDAEIAVRKHSMEGLLGVLKLMREGVSNGTGTGAGAGGSIDSGPNVSSMAAATGNAGVLSLPSGAPAGGNGAMG